MCPTIDRPGGGRFLLWAGNGSKNEAASVRKGVPVRSGVPVRNGVPIRSGVPVRNGVPARSSLPVQITPGFWLLLAWFAAVNGWGTLLLALGAAAVHEAGHLLALSLCGRSHREQRQGLVRGLRVSVQGAALDIEASRLSYGRELLCVLAGPAANFLLALLAARLAWDALAGASLLLGLYNLLPVRPLDGGRTVELAVSRVLGPRAGELAARFCGALSGLLLAAGAVWLMVRSGGTLWLLLPLTGFLSSALREARGR